MEKVFLLSIVLMLWITARLIHVANPLVMSVDVYQSLHYLFQSLSASLVLDYSLSYTRRMFWSPRVLYTVLAVEPLLTQVLFWLPPTRQILFSPGAMLWGDFNLIYTVQLLAIAIFFFGESMFNKTRTYVLHTSASIVGSLFPLTGNLLILSLPFSLENQMYIAVLSYGLTILGLIYGTFDNQVPELSTLTRETAIEHMDDGWMIVNMLDKIVDVNMAAQKMIGMTREQLHGLPISNILSDWNKSSSPVEGIKEMEMRRTVRAQNGWQYLNVRISPLIDNNGDQSGYLVNWRDITGRKLADVMHQKARDELFVLLNAISSLASRAMDMEEFLSQLSYQVIYSFDSQSIAVFLIEDDEESTDKLSLKSHFGFDSQQVSIMNEKRTRARVYEWMIKNVENRPLVCSAKNPLVEVPFTPAQISFKSMVLIPLIIYTQNENNMIGCLCLCRNDQEGYSQDEVIRLTTIANQISTLIDSNRRKQSAIAFNERQRLLRDLHDSVSQKLYGLVALTEAAQANIEAGVQISPVEVLTRIGENARQAVKEMRLFLYEMQPMDLKDGIVASLQHRLAAVEGRADIRPRMLSDENIQLDKATEIALFFIAQEALNNVLRHAHARTVTVNLRQTEQQVILEVRDDGQGFDESKIDNAGMGLRNMKERARRVNGVIEISTNNGTGTHVVVSVARKVS